MARKRKSTSPAPPTDEPLNVTPPPVAEAATAVEPDDLDPIEPVTFQTSSPTTITPWDEPIPPYPEPQVDARLDKLPANDAALWVDQLPADTAAIPVVIPPWDRRANQISAGKLISKHLGIPPASAQLRAGQLSDGQIREILAASLAPDVADLIRSVLHD